MDPSAVNLKAPLLPQIPGMGDGYEAWVHRSLKSQGSLRIFRSDLLESLTHPRWWLVPLVWVPVVVGLLVVTTSLLGLPAGQVAGLFVAGVFVWTFLEYLLHRFFFHHRFRSGPGRQLHFLAHGIHHLDPWDRTRLVFPPLGGFVVAAVIFGALWLVLPLASVTALMAGILTGYVAYDMTHYYTHHAKPTTRWGKYLKRYHLEHHHKHPERLFGVSSPLWDILLRTGRPPVG